MKLTNHQKEIVDKIISGEISDISSYLRAFSKAHIKQYDPKVIEATFEKSEDGAKYLFKESHNGFYTEKYDKSGVIECALPGINRRTYEMKEYPLDSPVLAQLDMLVRSESISYRDSTYIYDFMKNGYLVADNFSDIRDFVALWSYLRREALVFEGKKPVTEEDISIFFESVDQEICPQGSPYWQQKTEIVSSTKNDPIPMLHTEMVPVKSANHYVEKAWKLNEEHLAMCDEYVGVRMLATSELKNYQQSRYRTVEEKSQNRNLAAAWAAVFISIVSVLIGNIVPLFQKTDIDCLENISKQVSVIQETLERNAVNQDILVELMEIHDELEQITEKLESKTTEDDVTNDGVTDNKQESIK